MAIEFPLRQDKEIYGKPPKARKDREREREKGGRCMAPARQPAQEREREGSRPAGKRRGLTLAGATNDNTRGT